MGKLIRLELYNFKSYKGHHVLLLSDSYFTSVIGPNGSGKSNSMDAISFVLGIKSSHLRSAHLRDLVYRGRVLKTSTINGDGSATTNGVNGHVNGDAGAEEEVSQSTPQERNDPKSAWVMAVYEDDAGEEQRWKRTITNQGASEYRINDRQVTAQQYNEALEAENILIKARNFLVFQGDVEAIASQSPRDLTRLVEQISGSLEYKAEYEKLKEQNEEAAEHQSFNLQRRRGMNSELKQYKEQEQEAQAYTKKVDQRDDAIVTHILWKLYHFQRTIDESEAEIQKFQEELKEHRHDTAEHENDLEAARRDQAKVSRDVTKYEKSIKLKEKDIETKEQGVIPITEKINITNNNLNKSKARVEDISKQRESHTQTVKQYTKDLRTIEKAQSQWESEFQSAARKKGRDLSQADLQEYRRLKEEMNKRSAESQMQMKTLERQQKGDEETVNSLKSRVDSAEFQAMSLKSTLTQAKESRNELQSQIKKTTKDIANTKKAINEHTSERLRLAQIRTEKDEHLQDVLRKLLDAEDGRRQDEKELRLRTTIADLRRAFPGVKGRVSELCKPIEKKYGTAVSTILGRNFDSVIVDSEKTATDCIQFLREQRRSPNTFIPLETIQYTAMNSNLKGSQKGVRMAIDAVTYDKSLERAIAYVFGNAVVCDDMKTAKDICWGKRNDVKAVTLDGSIIHKGGNMTGGQGSKGNARHWEDTNVDNLRKMKDKLMADLQAMPAPRHGRSEEETLQGELVGLEQKLAYSQEEIKALERNMSSKETELSHVQDELRQASPKYKEKQRELESLKESLKEQKQEANNIEDEIFAQFCQRLGYPNIRVYEAQQGSLQQEGAQKRLEFSTQISRLQSKISYEQQQIQELEGRIKTLEKRMEQSRKEASAWESEREAINNDLDTMGAELEQLEESLTELKAKLDKAAEKVNDKRREVQKRSKAVDATLKNINECEAQRQLNAANRYTLLRRCKLDAINIPLTDASASLDSLPIDQVPQADPDAMDVDVDPDATVMQTSDIQDYGIEVDYEDLDEDLKDDDGEKIEEELEERIAALNTELDSLTPNMRAEDRAKTVAEKLRTVDNEFEEARKRAVKAKEDFATIKKKRFDLFNKAFTHISEQIQPIYKDLTREEKLPMGGQAYLDIEDSDEPYLSGIKYHAMPPLKRFRDMEHLSGGEKTMAALALLFAVHSYQPSPFFVLDEVDAALDNANVAKIAKYIQDHAGPGMQFIVISLKTGLFQGSEALVGIYRDQSANSSKALTLDLRKYQ